MKDPAENGGHDERVSHSSDGISDLVTELRGGRKRSKDERQRVVSIRLLPFVRVTHLDVVLIEPSSRDNSESVEAGDRLLSEDSSEAVSDDSSDLRTSKEKEEEEISSWSSRTLMV